MGSCQLANLEAAVLCNHTKKESGNWRATKERYQERQARTEERMESKREALQAGQRQACRAEGGRQRKERLPPRAPTSDTRCASAIEIAWPRRRRRSTRRERRCARAQVAMGKIKAQAMIAGKKRTWNLGTSLKSYIDPRVYYRWGQDVDYDVLSKYYPTILQRKFAWVRLGDGGAREQDEEMAQIVVRTCMSNDLPALEEMFRALLEEYPNGPFGLEAEGDRGALPAQARGPVERGRCRPRRGATTGGLGGAGTGVDLERPARIGYLGRDEARPGQLRPCRAPG